jgi:hypothetical protein
MAYFVKLNENNYVTDVYAVDNSIIVENGVENEELGISFLRNLFNNNENYKQTSYNTRGGIHYQNNGNTPSEDQNKTFRKNYAGIGYTYDQQRNAFIPPKPYLSWIFNEFSCRFEPHISYPNDGNNYIWDENILNWVQITNNG